ncbi:MAG: hypothetical protein ABH885_05505, partial [Candidatus Omnitrophota bacterium]
DSCVMNLGYMLGKFNDILECELTQDTDDYLPGTRERARKPADGWFYRFGGESYVSREPLLSLWGKKGLNLVRMAREGIPVPPGVILSAELTTRPDVYNSPEFRGELEREISQMRDLTGYHLTYYARSGSAFMLPGLLVTIPNIGMNDARADLLAERSGDPWFAYNTYASFLRAYAVHVIGIHEDYFESVLQNEFGVNVYRQIDLEPDKMRDVCRRYKEIIACQGRGQSIPEEAMDQIMLAVNSVYASWDSEEARGYRARKRISQEWGTAVIIEKSVYGNRWATADGRISGTGHCSLKVLDDGREVLLGRFRYKSQGEQLMSGADRNYVILSDCEKVHDNEQTLESLEPERFNEILYYARRLKDMFGNNQHIEFTVESFDSRDERGAKTQHDYVWITQCNEDFIKDDYPEFEDSPGNTPVTRGHGVSGGALRGWVATTVDAAKRLKAKYNDEKPPDVDGVILLLDRVNQEMVNELPEGVHIVAFELSVHAETVARGSGITVVSGLPERDYQYRDGTWYIAGHTMRDGDTISIDGHDMPFVYHNSGAIFLGSLPIAADDGGRAVIERWAPLTPAPPEAVSAPIERVGWEEVVAAERLGLTVFDRGTLIPLFEDVMRGTCSREALRIYHVQYRILLSKIVRACEGLDFGLNSAAFGKALDARLAGIGVSRDLLEGLYKHYYPYETRFRKCAETLSRIFFILSGIQPDDSTVESITVTGSSGSTRTFSLSDTQVGRARKNPEYYILNQPAGEVAIVSFDWKDVIEPLWQEGVSSLFKFFNAIKALGLKIAITASFSTSVNDWLKHVELQYPEMCGLVDYCFGDLFSARLGRYEEKLGIAPNEIMHFASARDVEMGGGSHAVALHNSGYAVVLVEGETSLRSDDIIHRRVDVLMTEMDTGLALEVIRKWALARTALAGAADPARPAEPRPAEPLGECTVGGLAKSAGWTALAGLAGVVFAVIGMVSVPLAFSVLIAAGFIFLHAVVSKSVSDGFERIEDWRGDMFNVKRAVATYSGFRGWLSDVGVSAAGFLRPHNTLGEYIRWLNKIFALVTHEPFHAVPAFGTNDAVKEPFAYTMQALLLTGVSFFFLGWVNIWMVLAGLSAALVAILVMDLQAGPSLGEIARDPALNLEIVYRFMEDELAEMNAAQDLLEANQFSTDGIESAIDPAELPYPDGVNVGIVPYSTAGLSLAGYMAARGDITGVNFIYLIPTGNVFTPGKGKGLYARYGLFVGRDGRVRYGRFKKPVCLDMIEGQHFAVDEGREGYFERTGVPCMVSTAVDSIVNNKAAFSAFMEANGINHPATMAIPGHILRSMDSDSGMSALVDGITDFVCSLGPRGLPHGLVIKPNIGCGGSNVRMFLPYAIAQMTDFIKAVRISTDDILIQERLPTKPFYRVPRLREQPAAVDEESLRDAWDDSLGADVVGETDAADGSRLMSRRGGITSAVSGFFKRVAAPG